MVILDLRILSGIYPQIVSYSPKVQRAPQSLYVGGAIEVTKNDATYPKTETVYETIFFNYLANLMKRLFPADKNFPSKGKMQAASCLY